MKRIIVFLTGAILVSFKSYAIYPDLTVLSDGAPQFCGQCTAEQLKTLESGIEVVQKVSTREGQKEMFNQVEAHVKSYATAKGKDLLQNYKNKKKKKKSGDGDEKPISYTRMIKKSKTDLEKVEDVQEAFKKYFLFVPSKNEEIQASYKEKREQFIEDTTIELYITSKEMDKELRDMLMQLDFIQKCVINNQDKECKNAGMEEFNCQKGDDTEDEMCHRRNALLVANIYDTIMKYNEYLLAMQAQYEAIRNLGSGVKPKENNKKSKKEALSFYTEESFGYASQEPNGEEEDEPLIVDEIPESDFDFTDEVDIGIKTPLEGKEDDIKALEIFQKAQGHLSDAIESHNLKHQLPEFKEVFDTYHNAQKSHQKALKSVSVSQECVLNYLSKRYADSEKVWFDNCRIDELSGYACHYNPEKSTGDMAESKGLYDVFCPDDSAHKCYILNSDAYNEIGGMSGWVVDMYLKAKDELSDTEIDSDNYVISSSSAEPEEDRAAGSNTGSYAAEKLKYQVSGDEILVDKYKENARVLSRLNSSIGNLVNDEINKDTNGTTGASKFGVSATPFPLWNDQMNFYNQYIDDKYKNIWDYFANAPIWKNVLNLALEINEDYAYEPLYNEDGALVKTAEQLREEAEKAFNALLEGLAGDSNDTVLAEIEKILAEEKAALQNITNEHLQKLQGLNAERIVLYKKLENINVREANLNNEVTKQDSVINFADGYNSAAEGGVAMDAEYQNPKNPKKPFAESLQENIDKQKQNENAAESARSSALAQLGDGASREDILNAINAKEAEIKRERGLYVLNYYNAEQQAKIDLDNAISSLFEKNEETGAEERVLTVAQQAVKDSIELFPVLAEANSLTELLRQYALTEIEKTINEIEAMKNNSANGLYYAENNPKVVQLHTDMLKKIIEPDISQVISELGLAEEEKNLFNKYEENIKGIFSDFCEDVKCFEPDDRYFVGLIAQKKDLAAPKAAVKFSSAPMREMFSFGLEDLDYVDHLITKDLKIAATEYDIISSGTTGVGGMPGSGIGGTFKVKKAEAIAGDIASISEDGAKILLIASSLPESGIEIPEIWKIVLSYRPFVQKNVDFEKFLNQGDESIAIARSGIYPCISGTGIIDVVPNGDGTVWYARLSQIPGGYGKLSQCQALKLVNGEFIDIEANEEANKIGNLNSAEPKGLPKASELGNILKYAELSSEIVGENGLPIVGAMGIELTPYKPLSIKGLTFREEFLTALRKVSQIKDDKDLTAGYYMYKRILPENSQFGDYLNKMDTERMALESETKVKNKIYSSNVDDLVIVNSIYKAFRSMGYDFDRAKFDLSNEGYYKQTENILNERKESNIRLAKELLNGNIQLSSPDMRKRKNNLLNQIKILEADSDEIAEITGNESIEELTEKIKNKNADRALLKENKFDLNSQREEPVYCSNYGQ